MINIYSPVRKGSLVNQEGQFDIKGLIARGGTQIAVKATGKQQDAELDGGLDVDLPSLIEFCKRILMETGTLPKWIYIGVIVDGMNSQMMTYFSPNKEKFFSDIYNDIKRYLAGNLRMAEIEMVVKSFFDQNPDFRFNYLIIPLDSLLSGSAGGKGEPMDIRI